MKERNADKESQQDDAVEMIDIDIDLNVRSKMNDEKVFRLHKRFEEEENQVKEQIRMKENVKRGEEKKRQKKSTVAKEKSKKKAKPKNLIVKILKLCISLCQIGKRYKKSLRL